MRRCRSLITSCRRSDAANVIAVSLMTESEQTIAVILHEWRNVHLWPLADICLTVAMSAFGGKAGIAMNGKVSLARQIPLVRFVGERRR